MHQTTITHDGIAYDVQVHDDGAIALYWQGPRHQYVWTGRLDQWDRLESDFHAGEFAPLDVAHLSRELADALSPLVAPIVREVAPALSLTARVSAAALELYTSTGQPLTSDAVVLAYLASREECSGVRRISRAQHDRSRHIRAYVAGHRLAVSGATGQWRWRLDDDSWQPCADDLGWLDAVLEALTTVSW